MKIKIKCIDAEKSEILIDINETDTLFSLLEKLHTQRFADSKLGLQTCQLAGRQFKLEEVDSSLQDFGFQEGCTLQISTTSSDDADYNLSVDSLGIELGKKEKEHITIEDSWPDGGEGATADEELWLNDEIAPTTDPTPKPDKNLGHKPDVDDLKPKKKSTAPTGKPEKKSKKSPELTDGLTSQPSPVHSSSQDHEPPQELQESGKFKITIVEQTSQGQKKFSLNISSDETLSSLISLITYERRRRDLAPRDLRQFRLNGRLLSADDINSGKPLSSLGFSENTNLDVSTSTPAEFKYNLSVDNVELKLPQPLFPIHLSDIPMQLVAGYGDNETAQAILSDDAYTQYWLARIEENSLLAKAIFPEAKKKAGKLAPEEKLIFQQLTKSKETTLLELEKYLSQVQQHADKFFQEAVKKGEYLKALLILRGYKDKCNLNTALMSAILSRDDNLVKLLLDHNADPNYKSSADANLGIPEVIQGQHTPLTLAASLGASQVVQELLSHGADVNSEAGNLNSIPPTKTALVLAWGNRGDGDTLNTVRALLDYGATISEEYRIQIGIGIIATSALVLKELRAQCTALAQAKKQRERKKQPRLAPALTSPLTAEELEHLYHVTHTVTFYSGMGKTSKLIFASDSDIDEEEKLLNELRRFFRQIFGEDWASAIDVHIDRSTFLSTLHITGIGLEDLKVLTSYYQTHPLGPFQLPKPFIPLTEKELGELLATLSSSGFQYPKQDQGERMIRPIIITPPPHQIERLIGLFNRLFREHFGEHYKMMVYAEHGDTGRFCIHNNVEFSNLIAIIQQRLQILQSRKFSEPSDVKQRVQKNKSEPQSSFKSPFSFSSDLLKTVGILPPQRNNRLEQMLGQSPLGVFDPASTPSTTKQPITSSSSSMFSSTFSSSRSSFDKEDKKMDTQMSRGFFGSSSMPSSSNSPSFALDEVDICEQLAIEAQLLKSAQEQKRDKTALLPPKMDPPPSSLTKKFNPTMIGAIGHSNDIFDEELDEEESDEESEDETNNNSLGS